MHKTTESDTQKFLKLMQKKMLFKIKLKQTFIIYLYTDFFYIHFILSNFTLPVRMFSTSNCI